MRAIGLFIRTLVPVDFKYSDACVNYLFLDYGKKTWLAVVVGGPIILAHMLL